MTRRAFLLAAVALLPWAVQRRIARQNRVCHVMAAHRLRDGALTERERAALIRRGCKEENGEWMSALVFPAEAA